MTYGRPTWHVLWDEYKQEAAIAATLEIRKAATATRLHRSSELWRIEANELDRIAGQLEQLVREAEFAYRAEHPPENERSAGAMCDGRPGGSSTRSPRTDSAL
jgi:hypothetical protein